MDRILKLLLMFGLTFSLNSFAKTAMIKKVRGIASIIKKDGSKSKAAKDQWLEVGDKIVTAKKSFVRLLFADKTSVNVGAVIGSSGSKESVGCDLKTQRREEDNHSNNALHG